MADALGVTTDDVEVELRPSGSRRLALGMIDGADLLVLEELRGETGGLAGVEGEWGSTAEPVLDQSPLQRPQGPLPSAVADPIGEALEAPSLALGWAGATLLSADGGAFLPAPDGRGAGVSATGWIRVAADDGGTLTWMGPGGALNGLRLPTPFGTWTTPAGWIRYPAPPHVLDPPTAGRPAEPHGPGDVRAAALWWDARGVGADSLARLPLGLLGPDPRAWLAPRGATFAVSSRVPETEPAHAGTGAAVPAVPGARRLLPEVPGVSRTPPLTALVLSGDLPPDADHHRAFVALPAPAWTIEVPGAAILRDVARRRTSPTLPPGWRPEALAGLAPGLDGFLTADGARAAARVGWAPRPAIEGLPKGTSAVVPGLCASLPGAFGSLPVDARCTALEGLSDHPLVPGELRRRGVEDDALLLALPRLEARGPAPLGGWLDPLTTAEAWVLESPAGTRAALDGRGRLLSSGLGSRLRRASGRRAVAFAGELLLSAGAGGGPADPSELGVPPYLPQAGDVPETRWGLAPGDPRFPLTALGEPSLMLFRKATGLPPAQAGHVFPALL
jgi:hypothetical protein